MSDRRIQGAGGTPGGIKMFAIGFVMAVVGGYLLMNQVKVTTGFWSFFGFTGGFGVALLPFLFGVGLLFFNGRSIPGWFLTIGGLLVILAAVIANLQIYFVPTSLFNTLVMLVLLVGGLALIFRSLQASPGKS